MRRIIASDPTPKDSVSPEEVYSLLAKVGITTELDRDIGMIILSQMGFYTPDMATTTNTGVVDDELDPSASAAIPDSGLNF
ncbi:hypothetical protein HUJ04_011008 [Dendroctonus ponderosae]|nr:hypothetical protein HUJ04_011008 [Dendroctonus ponderosae]KAH1028254.1 hypothetical protein HUJ05_001629 [Dendroctonus ponderosae]